LNSSGVIIEPTPSLGKQALYSRCIGEMKKAAYEINGEGGGTISMFVFLAVLAKPLYLEDYSIMKELV
jgi:hypothetical protein